MTRETKTDTPWWSLPEEPEIEERATLDEKILLWLLMHPFSGRDDLAFATHRHPTSISRHLRALQHRQDVESIRPALGSTNASHLFYLTTSGIERVAFLLGAVPEKLARMWSVHEEGLRRLLPRLAIQMRLHQFVRSLIHHAPQRLGITGVLQWHWLHQYRYQTIRKHQKVTCLVDAAIVLRHENSNEPTSMYHSALILIDPGYVGPHDFKRMHERLSSVLAARECPQRWSSYQSFPPLLIVTESKRARERWSDAMQHVAQQHHLSPLPGAITTWSPERAFTTAWHLPWFDLATQASITLADLWQPMTRDALLPGLLAPRPIPEGTFQATRVHPSSTPTIVRGRFHHRAQQKNTAQTEITLLSVTLNQRHWRMLETIYAHPLLSCDELASILIMERPTIARYLSDLHRWDLIERHKTPYGKRLVVSTTGMLLFAARLGTSSRQLGEVSPLPARLLHHQAGLSRLIARWHRERETQVCWWETDAWCHHRYKTQGRWHTLAPDAALEVSHRERPLRFWLEYDCGTMRRRALATKFQAYRHYVQSRQWYAQSSILPSLLLVTHDYGREYVLHEMALEHLADLALEVRTTTEERFHRQGPSSAIWLAGSEGMWSDEGVWVPKRGVL